MGNSDQIAEVGLLWELKDNVSAEFERMGKDGGEFGPHDIVKGMRGVLGGIDASPRWTDDDCIGRERLYLQEVLIQDGQQCLFLPIDLQVLLQHFQLVLVNIIDHIFLEMASQMDCYSSHSTKWLKHLLHSSLLESSEQMQGNWFRDDGVPTFFINLYALVEAREKEVAFVEVSVQFGGDPVGLLQLFAAVVVAVEGKGGGLKLEVCAATLQVVVFSKNGLEGVVVDAGQAFLHQIYYNERSMRKGMAWE